MQYLDDIVELIEDLPDEAIRRFEQIRKWDLECDRLKEESMAITKQLFLPENLSDRERLVNLLAEKHCNLRELTVRKVDMMTRSERLMKAILEKVTESSYHCKCELEVDNPGCTAVIEEHFCQSYSLKPTNSHLTDCTMEFEPLDNCDTYSLKSEPDTFANNNNIGGIVQPRPVGRPRNILKERTNKGKNLKSLSPMSSSSQHGHNLGKKYKKRKDGDSQSHLSAYLRKKQERLREEEHIKAVQARKEKNTKMSLMEITSFPTQPCSNINGRGIIDPDDVKRELSATPATDHDDSWGGLDPLGSDDDLDELFPGLGLPSPPPELMESLGKEGPMFGMDDDGLSGMMSTCSSPRHSFTTPTSPMNINHHGSLNKTMSVLESEKRKKRDITFSSISDTSIHGRPRKLTDRAVELLQHNLEKEKMKRREDEDGDDIWCHCQRDLPGSQMIGCDSSTCKIQWFHMMCVGLTVVPAGKWYCEDCQTKLKLRS